MRLACAPARIHRVTSDRAPPAIEEASCGPRRQEAGLRTSGTHDRQGTSGPRSSHAATGFLGRFGQRKRLPGLRCRLGRVRAGQRHFLGARARRVGRPVVRSRRKTKAPARPAKAATGRPTPPYAIATSHFGTSSTTTSARSFTHRQTGRPADRHTGRPAHRHTGWSCLPSACRGSRSPVRCTRPFTRTSVSGFPTVDVPVPDGTTARAPQPLSAPSSKPAAVTASRVAGKAVPCFSPSPYTREPAGAALYVPGPHIRDHGGSSAVRARAVVAVAPPSRSSRFCGPSWSSSRSMVILVSSSARCPLRGRRRMS